jgi:two-component system invasion response regulator UvrY
MIKIFVADDHAIVRQGLKQIVADTHDIVVAGEASGGHEVLDKVLKNNYDVVLLDITMPGRSGLDILSELKSRKPGLPILVLSIHPEEQYAVRALKAGAAGYLTKGSASEELVAAIRKVSRGGKYISPYLAEKLAFDLETGAEEPLHQTLSDREYQVMCMIASGKTVKEIAEELLLSAKTVSTYRTRILLKMQMKNTAELIRYTLENRLCD